jgi:hypothetical protein
VKKSGDVGRPAVQGVPAAGNKKASRFLDTQFELY